MVGTASSAAQGDRNRAATPGKPRNAYRNPEIGTAFVHTVLDDPSRVAYAEIHSDETAVTAIAASASSGDALRRAALPGWLHFYNHHRPHSSTGGKPPVTG